MYEKILVRGYTKWKLDIYTSLLNLMDILTLKIYIYRKKCKCLSNKLLNRITVGKPYF